MAQKDFTRTWEKKQVSIEEILTVSKGRGNFVSRNPIGEQGGRSGRRGKNPAGSGKKERGELGSGVEGKLGGGKRKTFPPKRERGIEMEDFPILVRKVNRKKRGGAQRALSKNQSGSASSHRRKG